MAPELLENMRRHAVRRAHAMLPPGEVEDAAQHAMLGVLRAARRLDPGRDPWPLLTKVVRQELAMYARQYYSDREVALCATLPDVQDAPVVPEGLSFSTRVRAVLETLPPRQREAVVECVAEGRTKVAAAQLMGVSDARVGQLVREALPALRARLA